MIPHLIYYISPSKHIILAFKGQKVSMRNSKSVAVAIFSEDKNNILLVKRRDVPVWVLPGGGVEANESPQNAACREAFEETGYKVTIDRTIGEYFPINRLGRHTYLYICKILQGFSTITDETADISFFPIKNLPKEIPPPYLDWIQDSIKTPQGQYLKKKLTQLSYRKTLILILLHPIKALRFYLSRFGIPINSK